MKITTVGIDLAKSVFQVHGVDEQGNTVLRKQLKRDQLSVFMATLPPGRVAARSSFRPDRGRALARGYRPARHRWKTSSSWSWHQA
jgi:transposase